MWHRLQPVFVIARREVRDQFRDWRVIFPILVLTLIFPSLMNFTAAQAMDFVNKYGATIVGERLIPFFMMIVGFFPTTISLVIALESFVGEKERRSIEPLLSSPLEDWQLFLGKLLAVLLPPVSASYIGIAVYLVGIYRKIGWIPETGLLIQILAITFVQALVMVCGAVVISTQATSVRAANLLVSFVIIPVTFLMQGEAAVMFWGSYGALWWAIGGLVIIAFLLVRTGIGYFNRETLLGQEIDVLNFRWMWRTYLSAFKGEATSLRDWFRGEIGRTLNRMWVPAVIILVCILAGYLIGLRQAGIFQVPGEFINANQLSIENLEGLDTVSLSNPSGIPYLFLHNLRAIALATLLGVFSYGVLGILVLMLPFVVIGFVVSTISTAGVPASTMLLGFVLPHGLFEIPAIMFAGAAILQLGATLAAQSKTQTIGERVLRVLADWTKVIVVVVAPLLLAAAVIESLVTLPFGMWLLGQ